MSDVLYQKFVERFEEVMELPPQRVGALTPMYKLVSRHLKVMPWPLFVGISLVTIIGMYIFIGSTITFLVSLLQRGF